ncbi:CLUMA_CG019714, isoform A [Clunio marinus]|uniref:CLUMA_CG019714, isoform A n=1 Tax=Clunio marinus TaxID=568069 RepID=A0A1J1J2P3_9DIPT|nr:CLUMA_CG019714, isoform A [Clunio marinus]
MLRLLVVLTVIFAFAESGGDSVGDRMLGNEMNVNNPPKATFQSAIVDSGVADVTSPPDSALQSDLPSQLNDRKIKVRKIIKKRVL